MLHIQLVALVTGDTLVHLACPEVLDHPGLLDRKEQRESMETWVREINAACIPNLSCDSVIELYVISLCINHLRFPWHGWHGWTPWAKGRTW